MMVRVLTFYILYTCKKTKKDFYQQKHLSDIIDVILVSLSLTLNWFHLLFVCFHCWLLTSKWFTLDDDTSKKALLLHTAIICIAHLKFQKISTRWNHRSGFYPSTFPHPVNSSKNSILYWVFKLNLLKSLQVFSLFV